MYCLDGTELKLEDPQEMELFPSTEITYEQELLKESRDADSTMNILLEGSDTLELADLLSETLEFQNLSDFVSMTNVSSDANPVVGSWDTLFSYGDQAVVNAAESDSTDVESWNGGDEEECTSPCLGYTDDQLLSMSAKEVNRIKGVSKDEIVLIKKRRRVLLNRCYARKSREKRLDAQTTANQEKEILRREMDELKEQNETIRRERDMYKQKYNALKEIIDNAISERVAKTLSTQDKL